MNSVGKPIRGSRISVLGVAYKRDVDDPRKSPAFKLMMLLEQEGAELSYSDPFIPELPKMRHFNVPRMSSQTITPTYLRELDCDWSSPTIRPSIGSRLFNIPSSSSTLATLRETLLLGGKRYGKLKRSSETMMSRYSQSPSIRGGMDAVRNDGNRGGNRAEISQLGCPFSGFSGVANVLEKLFQNRG